MMLEAVARVTYNHPLHMSVGLPTWTRFGQYQIATDTELFYKKRNPSDRLIHGRQWAGEEKFILAGGSYGGLIALGYTLANPGRVLALILRSTCAYGYRAVLRGISIISGFRDHINLAQQLRLASGSTLNSHDFEMAMADLVPIGTVENKLAANPSSHDDESEPKKKNYHHETHNAAFSFNMPRFDVRARLREIKTPTFIVVGRLDPVTPVEDAQELHDGIRNSQLAIFENSAHSPPLEEPDAFRERVWGFLSQTLQMMVHSSEPRRGHWSKSML